MSGDRLRKLEQGFLNGELTDFEEAELKTLLQSTENDSPLKAYFGWIQGSLDHEVPEVKVPAKPQMRHLLSPVLLRVAASVIIIATMTFFWVNRTSEKTHQFSQAEIEESYQKTMETLAVMSSYLNESIAKVELGLDISSPFSDLQQLKKIKNDDNEND